MSAEKFSENVPESDNCISNPQLCSSYISDEVQGSNPKRNKKKQLYLPDKSLNICFNGLYVVVFSINS